LGVLFPADRTDAESRRLRREAIGAAVVAAAGAAVVIWLAPPGIDLAAHLYLRSFFLQHGFSLWNNFWYAGRYQFVTYSIIYYPLAALLGLNTVSILSVAMAAYGFTVVAGRQWGRTARWSSRSFAVAWPGVVLTGTLPFALGIALAFLGLVALQQQRYRLVALWAVLALAASPLAFAVVAAPLAGTMIANRTDFRRFVRPAAVVVGAGAAELLLWRLFPATGHEPFWSGELIGACVFSFLGASLTWRVEGTRMLRWPFVLYGLASIVVFFVPTELGGSIARIRLAAVPIGILIVAHRKWRPLPVCVLAMGLAVWWNVGALTSAYAGAATDPGSKASFWQPAITYLQSHLTPDYRVEVVDTVGHWPAMYFPQAGIPLARGWFRQDDFPQNNLLYHPLTPDQYVAWLHSLGIEYVVLSDAPSDFSSAGEAALLQSGRSGLAPAWRSSNLTVYGVPGAQAMVTGPGSPAVVRLEPASMSLSLGQAGSYRVAVRWSPYWKTSDGCLEQASDGMIRLTTDRPGLVELTFGVNPSAALHALTHASTPACAAGSPTP
jgi:hypothetical protein